MNILQVTLGYYPAIAWGGPVKIVHQYSRELIERGHHVTVFCTNLLNKREKIEQGTFERTLDGIRVVYFDTINLSWWPGTLGPIWLPDLTGYLIREISTYDVIHINGSRNLMVIPIARAARRAEIPYIIQPHGGLPIIVNSFVLKRLYDRLLGNQEFKGMNALIALQEAERIKAVERGIPDSLIEIIPNGIDLSEQRELPEKGEFRNRFSIPLENPLILFLGRINRKKGTDMLVKAFAKLDNNDAILAIVGPDDGQLTEVISLIKEYRIKDRVILTGLLTGKDVLGALQDADLFVLPCRTDTYPTTIMEACLTNTPMVITDGCEIAYLVKDRVAEVVPFDIQAFASGVRFVAI